MSTKSKSSSHAAKKEQGGGTEEKLNYDAMVAKKLQVSLAVAKTIVETIKQAFPEDPRFKEQLRAVLYQFSPLSSRARAGYNPGISMADTSLSTIKKIVKQDPREWRPELWATDITRAEEIARYEEEDVKPKEFSNHIACPRCKKFMVSYTERQMRSGDEGATMLGRCWADGCGHRWKVN